MQYRQLGRSGVRVSQVGLGTDQFGPRVDRTATARIVGAALDAGITFYDTADIYSLGDSESFLGAALQGHRDEVVIATKAGRPMGKGANDEGSSRVHLVPALEASFKRLGTDYVDLYQIHIYDPTTPMDELMRTLDDLVSSGKVRYLGASNCDAWQVCRCNDIAEATGRAPFVTVQPHYHLLERVVEREMLPYCRM
ncbi:MAG: aldo/keto reductase, partial [Chloroflexota bacterium]